MDSWYEVVQKFFCIKEQIWECVGGKNGHKQTSAYLETD